MDLKDTIIVISGIAASLLMIFIGFQSFFNTQRFINWNLKIESFVLTGFFKNSKLLQKYFNFILSLSKQKWVYYQTKITGFVLILMGLIIFLLMIYRLRYPDRNRYHPSISKIEPPQYIRIRKPTVVPAFTANGAKPKCTAQIKSKSISI